MRTHENVTAGEDHPQAGARPATASAQAGGRTSNPAAAVALIAATAYGGWRLWWQLAGTPGDLSPTGDDLVGVTGWGAVILCATAAVLATALLPGHTTGLVGRLLRITAGLAGLAMVTSGAMLLLDVVAAVLPGLGVDFYPVGALSRVACVGAGLSLIFAVHADLRQAAVSCATCRRPWAATGALDHLPRWAWIAGYVSVAGCLIRIVAQAAVGMDQSPLSRGMSALLFELGFVLGGTLLPLALVHRWGRIWPRWVPVLAGRTVPRWVVLGPGIGISGGLVVYFGFMQAQMIVERLNGRNPFPPSAGVELPEAFFWVAVPGYLTWGLGLAVASLAYYRRTKRPCPECGH